MPIACCRVLIPPYLLPLLSFLVLMPPSTITVTAGHAQCSIPGLVDFTRYRLPDDRMTLVRSRGSVVMTIGGSMAFPGYSGLSLDQSCD
jgi:hypothetical protein